MEALRIERGSIPLSVYVKPFKYTIAFSSLRITAINNFELNGLPAGVWIIVS